MKKDNLKILGILFLFVFLLEFWVSINSYTHDLYIRIDSAIFFMSGKAWMNGMIPYVDFADSKGPLLWLIYGIGYLLSNHNYVGVFWMECIFYTVTFFYCYKITRLFLPNQNIALLCSMLMALAFFCGAYHYEASAEDFCQPFIAAGLYYTLRMLVRPQSEKDIKIASFIVGVGFAATLLIKFTLAVMIMILFFTIFYYLIKCRKDLICFFFVYAFSGISLVLLPFSLYFLYTGNFGDFINEYFIATTQTVIKDASLGGMLKDYLFTGWGSIFKLHPLRSMIVCFLLVNIGLGCVFFYKKLSGYKLFPAIIAFWFICISMYHALGYYYQAFAVFAIYPIIMYLTFINRFKLKDSFLICAALAIIVIVMAGNLLFQRPAFFLNESKERTEFYYVNSLMSQVSNPKIMYSFYDTGYGTPVHALPACKYWTGQVGITDKMVAERKLAITQQRPDFVIVLTDFGGSDEFINLLQQSGYIEYYTWVTQEGTKGYDTILYGKPGFSLPSNNVHVGRMDILLKRRISPVKDDN